MAREVVVVLVAVMSIFVLSEGLQTCVPGSKFQKEGYECTCIAGRWSCTEKVCPSAECIETTRWKKDCNDCVCKNGTAICTSRNCTKLSRTARSVSCLFKEGNQFRDPTPGSCAICRCKSMYEYICDDYDMKCGFDKLVTKVKNTFRSWKSKLLN